MKNRIQYRLLRNIMMDTFLLIIIAIFTQLILSYVFDNIGKNTLINEYIDLSKILWNKSGELLIYYTDIIRIGSFVLLLIPYAVILIKMVKELVVNPLNQIISGLEKIDSNNLEERLETPTNFEFTKLKIAFNNVLERLEKASNERDKLESQKDLLITGMAHDLKTPITTICGYSQALNEGVISDENEKIEYFTAINRKAIQLDHLISLLFDYVKLSGIQNNLRFENVDLIELIRENLGLFYTDFEEKGIHFQFQLPEKAVIVQADHNQLDRVFANVYSNALKYNYSGDTVNTRIDLTDGITVYIEDNGNVIPGNIVENIFDPFVTVDESRKNGSGNGLGLSIASKIMELHHGSITLIQECNSKFTKSFVIRL